MRTPTDPLGTLAFIAVAEAHGFREAARVLGIPKSTLSQRVAALEERLGAQLLTRSTRRLQLTDAGESYYRDVTPAIDTLRAAEARIVQLKAQPSGRLRMTAPFELGQGLFGELLAEYGARYSEVRLEVVLLDRQVDLIAEGFDLALRVGPLDDSRLVARRVAAPQTLRLYASADYLRRSGTPRHPDELGAHRCLIMSGAREPRVWRFEHGREKLKVTIEPQAEVNSFLVLCELTKRSLGIARMPDSYAAGSQPPLREVLGAYAPPPRECFLVYPNARHISPALRAMVDLAAERFAQRRFHPPSLAASAGSATALPSA
jgi:DNA-binding transcriptional LysR family regulator